jgi:hypothetical protein
MITEYEMREATIENISSSLQPFMSAWRSPSWKAIMDAYEGEQQIFGELRDPVDWNNLPKGKYFRIVYLVDELGPVIRWLLPEDPQYLGGIFHEDLARGDGAGTARSGWLKVLEHTVRVG